MVVGGREGYWDGSLRGQKQRVEKWLDSGYILKVEQHHLLID